MSFLICLLVTNNKYFYMMYMLYFLRCRFKIVECNNVETMSLDPFSEEPGALFLVQL